MIITKTPLRIPFFSGGSDLPAFYMKEEGAALSATIDKYIYVSVHKTNNNGIRLKFDNVENVNDIDEMEHTLTKQTLNHFYNGKGINGWEISSISDVSYHGCGLGTSSAFTVGLINCLVKPGLGESYLATEACKIEIDRCQYPIGKQDQYAAAHGGMKLYNFLPNGLVKFKNVEYPKYMEENFLLMYSGKSRNANDILKTQSTAMMDDTKFNLAKKNRDRAYQAANMLQNNDLDSFGSLLGEAWSDKKQVAKGITDSYIDEVYDTAVKEGALGGKILGAGGGGFFLFYVPCYNIRMNVKKELESKFPKVKEFKFNFVDEGSKILYNDKA